MIFNMVYGGKGAGGLAIDVVTATLLPSAVKDGQVVVLTSTTPGKITFSYDTPTDPAAGDIWIHTVDNGGYTLSADEAIGIRITPGATMQYNGSIWEYRNAYIGVSGEWKLFSTLSPLSSLTWTQVISIANSGEDPSMFFAVGDEHDLILTTGEVVTAVIGDFKHNTITGTNNKAALAFTFKNCLNTTYAMNSSATTSGGWNNCQMRTTTMLTILNTFPLELTVDGAIKYIDVVASDGPSSTNLITSSDRLRLHSVTELGLSDMFAVVAGTKYAYYASGNRAKKVNNIAGVYWTRSPSTTSSPRFHCVDTTGKLYTNWGDANKLLGVSCCFDI